MVSVRFCAVRSEACHVLAFRGFAGLVSHGESVAALSGSVEPSSTSLVSLDGIGRECQCVAECNSNH